MLAMISLARRACPPLGPLARGVFRGGRGGAGTGAAGAARALSLPVADAPILGETSAAVAAGDSGPQRAGRGSAPAPGMPSAESAAAPPSPGDELLLMKKLCSSSRQCSRADLRSLMSVLRGAGGADIDIAAVGHAARCLRYISLRDCGAALPCMAALTARMQALHTHTPAGAPPVRKLFELLMAVKQFTDEPREVRQFLSQLAASLRAASDTAYFSGRLVGGALFALRGMRGGGPEVRAVLAALAPHIQTCPAPFLAQDVGSAVYGLHNMSSDCPEVCAVVAALSPLVQACAEPLTGEFVGQALHGLRGMRSDAPETRLLLAALYRPVAACRAPLSSQAVGMGLLGLRHMTSDWPQVRSLLAALAGVLSAPGGVKEPMTAQNLANALFGLRNMNSDVPEVRQLLAALRPHVQSCAQAMNAQHVANAVFGLRGMSSEVEEVRAMLTALLAPVSSCAAPLSAMDVASVMYGLRRMSSGAPEVRALLAALTGLIVRSSSGSSSSGRESRSKGSGNGPPLSTQEVEACMNGLRRMSSDEEEVRLLLPLLTRLVARCPGRPLTGGAANVMHGLRGMSSEVKEVRELLLALCGPGGDTHAACMAVVRSGSLSHFDGALERMDRDVSEVCVFLCAADKAMQGATTTTDSSSDRNSNSMNSRRRSSSSSSSSPRNEDSDNNNNSSSSSSR
jgi:hypothetical protein